MPAASSCFHCGEANPAGAVIYARLGNLNQPVCCLGCKAVAEFICNSGLDSFYQHREAPHPELGLKVEASEWRIYDDEDLLQRYVKRDADKATATVDIGGMYCAACVWLLDNALKQHDGIESVSVNPATRRAVIEWDAGKLMFSELLQAIAMVGFKPSPSVAGLGGDEHGAEDKQALKRLIVAAAAGMQVMMFAVALYAGEAYGIEGGIEQFLRMVSLLVCLPIVFYSARPFFAAALRGLRARAPGMDLPVSLAIGIAFVASLRAVLLGDGVIYFDSVAMFVLFLSATRYLEMRARHRSEDHAQALARLLPETVTRVRDGRPEVVAIDRLRRGDVVLIRPGDVIPADGVVLSGDLAIDEAMLTGESVPVSRRKGMDVFAGGINRSGNASIEIRLTGASTSLAEIGRLLERARSDRPPVSVLADRIAGKFVLAVLLIASVTGLAWLRIDPSRALEVVLATLVVTCPCALSLATPAALAAAASRLARDGFLLVRSRVLDVFARPVTIVFDKTGTLTEGRPSVVETVLFPAAGNLTENDCLALAARLETASEHVLARAFAPHLPACDPPIGDTHHLQAAPIGDTHHFQGTPPNGDTHHFQGTPPIEDTHHLQGIVDVLTFPGAGVAATVAGTRFRIGSAPFVAEMVESMPADRDGDRWIQVWLAGENGLLARFSVGDELRSDAIDAVKALQRFGHRILVASGDRAAVVASVAKTLGIEDWHAAMTPAEKVALVHRLQADGQKILMVGDGINDAPVLSAADASIAIDAGTALARASADAIAMGKRLKCVVDAAVVAARTRVITNQNLGWAIAYNLCAVPLAAGGVLAPWMAAIGMSASSFIVVLNALRIQNVRSPAMAADATSSAEPIHDELTT